MIARRRIIKDVGVKISNFQCLFLLFTVDDVIFVFSDLENPRGQFADPYNTDLGENSCR